MCLCSRSECRTGGLLDGSHDSLVKLVAVGGRTTYIMPQTFSEYPHRKGPSMYPATSVAPCPAQRVPTLPTFRVVSTIHLSVCYNFPPRGHEEGLSPPKPHISLSDWV